MTTPTGKPTKRKHLPALNPKQLELTAAEIDKLKVSPATKKHLKSMFQAAANPLNETPEVVIKTLSKERQTNIQALQQAVGSQTVAIGERGGKALLSMDDAEFNQLLDEANAQ